MSPRQKIKMFLPVFNATILLIYLINFDIFSKFLFCIVAVCLCFCFLCVLGVKSSAIIIQYLYKIQISLFTLILLFLFFELLSFLSPTLFPLRLLNYLATEDIVVARSRMLEYLPESLFVKFKSNVTIRSQGYRGTENQFVYEWESDKKGFKNLEKVADSKQVDIVAVGDSFTEGMGVSTDNTWPSVLTKHNFVTYNLGVQGYAPKQFEGSLRKYGLQLHPKYIIIGYCPGIYLREIKFFDENQAVKKREFTGGIQSILNDEKSNIQRQAEIREQAQYVFSAIYLLARQVWMDHHTEDSTQKPKINEIATIEESLVNKGPLTIQSCKQEVLAVGTETAQMGKIESESREWKSTIFAFTKIVEMAASIDAKVILLYLPTRGVTYFRKVTGKDLPKRYLQKVESNALKLFADNNNIVFLDLSEKMANYVDDLPDNASIDKYPFLLVDGHPSNCGNALIAEEILNYLKLVDFKPLSGL